VRTLDGKVVVITGAGSGIGRALALDMAGRGAVLALSDWDEVGLVETGRLVALRTPVEARTDKLDVRDRTAMHEYAASVATELGRVDVVVNNAGVTLHGNFEDVAYEDFDWVLDVDLGGVVNASKEFLPHLIVSGDGHLVNMSSLFGLIGMPGQTAYNAAKFAVRGFTEALREEMLVAGHPVAVTCVHPGGVKTNIVRNARTTASEEKDAVVRLFDERLAITTPEKAAAAIVAGVLAGKPRVVIGRDAKRLDAAVRLVGPRYQRWVALAARRVGRPT
jgi:NADP-dependent 3-hydroxy acid dehydrogenase YdfG